MEEQNKKKKRKFLLIMIPVVLLLAAAIVLGVKGRDWFGPAEEPSTEQTDIESQSETETEQSSEEAPQERTSALFWNVERSLYAYKSDAGLSSRTLDKEDQTYHILFASEGRQVTRRTKDKKVLNEIDNYDVMGLEFGEDGLIIGVIPLDELTGGYLFRDCFVQEQDGTLVTLNSSDSFMGEEYQIDTAGGFKIFDVSGAATYVGIELSKPEFKVGDKMSAILDKDGNVKVAYLTYSLVHTDMYWNVERMWDAGNGISSRMPDRDGVFTFLLAVNGEQVTVKTKDRTVADAMDGVAAKSFGLVFDEEGYAIARILPAEVTHGKSIGSWYDIMELNGYDFHAKKTIQASDTGREVDGTIAKDCEIYDVSGMGKFVGEIATVRQYDRMQGYTGPDGQVHVLYIVSRRIDAPIYWNVTRQYDSDKKETKRVKSADGYYHFKMCSDGKVYDLKTTSKELASKVDAAAARTLGIIQSGGIIKEVYDGSNIYSSKGSWYDVTNIYSSDLIHVKKTITATDTGNQYDIDIASDCKVFNVTETYVNNIGERTTLRVGDRIQGWTDLEGKAKIIFVVNRDAKNPMTAHKTAHTCEECGENVTWTAWTSGSSLPTTTGHYYLTGPVACPQQSIAADQHVVLCMNGYNIRCTGRRLYATFESGATLSLHDCTGKSKMFSSYEGDLGTTQGGLLWVRYGSIKIYGGTYDISNQVMPNTGGLIDVSGATALEIYGGTFIGGETKVSGGIINVRPTGKLVLAGGTFKAGLAADHKGDGIYLDTAADVTIQGKPTMTGGTTQVYLADGVKLKLNGIESGASLGITLANGAGIFTTNYEAGAENCFKADDTTMAVGKADDALAIGTSAVTGIALNESSVEMLQNADEQLTATLSPEGAISKITWSSSDETKATVDQNGLVTAVGQGTATIYAKTENGQEATCTVTVSGYATRATGVAFESATVEVLTGAAAELKVNFTPEDTTVKTVTFTSSDETVATVDENGMVTGLKEGSAVITVTTKDGGFTATTTVTVKAHVHCVCGAAITVNGHTCSDITWIPWTSTTSLPKDAADNNKYYYLTSDVNIGAQQMIAQDTNIFLCLNGHTISSVGNDRIYSTFNTGTSLTVTDCSAGETGKIVAKQNVAKTQQGNALWARYGTISFYRGTIDGSGIVTQGTGATMEAAAGTTINIYGGTIIGGKTTGTGGNVCVRGTLNIYAGTLKGGDAKYGGNVDMQGASAVVNFYDGLITEGKTTQVSGSGGQGGNVSVTNGTFNMYGGTISNGTANGNTGGNISAVAATSYFKMSGGLVTGGKSTTNAASNNYGSFASAAGSLTVSGGQIDGYVYIGAGWASIQKKAVITGGTTNITLADGKKLAVSTNLEAGANIGLTMKNPGVFATATNTSLMPYFHSDDPAYSVVMTGSGMALSMAATDLQLDYTEETISAGGTLQITATTTPAGVSGIAWTSSDEAVATVANGLVTAVKDGDAVITAEVSGIQKTCNIKVYTYVTSITVELEGMMVGQTAQAQVTVNPENASNKGVIYNIDNELVATVDSNGLVSGQSIGTTTLTVTSKDDSTKKGTATVNVTEFIVPVESVSLDQSAADLDIDKTLTLTATVLPNDATHKEVTWSSSDTTIATVANGVVTPMKGGEVTITATSTSDTTKAASCIVTVKAHEHCVCSGTTALTGHATHTTITWIPWSTATALPTTSGNYFLTTDVTYANSQYSQPANTDVKICLNGHTITRGTTGRVISAFNSGAKLTLTDCAATPGTVKVKAGTASTVQGAGVWVRSGATFDMYRITVDASEFTADDSYGTALCIDGGGAANVYSGTLKGGTAKYGGTVNVANNGTVNFYDGLITGGRTNKHSSNGGGQGGNVNVIGTFNMYGGEISNGNANGNAGGNVAVMIATSRFTMSGGLIHGGTSTSLYSGNVGVAFQAVDGAFKMSGGEIDGGVNITVGEQEFSGTARVASDRLNIVFGGGSMKAGPFEDGAMLGVSSSTRTVQYVLQSSLSNDYIDSILKYFKADNPGSSVYNGNSQLCFGISPGATAHSNHCICGGSAAKGSHTTHTAVTWTQWTSTTTLPNTSGNYYLSGNVTPSQVVLADNVNINLCLNGYTVTIATNRPYCVNGANSSVTICDCRETETDGQYRAGRIVCVAGTAVAPINKQGLALFIYGTNAKATLYGGIIDGHQVYSSSTDGAVVWVGSGKTFEMYGGQIIGGTSTQNGGAIFTSGTVKIEGGTIIGGKANKGGAIYINQGTTTIKNCTIKGGQATAEGGNLRIHSGTLTMENCVVEGGTANNGGNLFANINTTTTFKNCTFKGGVAGNQGGNICLNAANGYNPATMTAEASTIINGQAKLGGNVCINASGSCTSVFHFISGLIKGGTASGDATTNNVRAVGTFDNQGGTVE